MDDWTIGSALLGGGDSDDWYGSDNRFISDSELIRKNIQSAECAGINLKAKLDSIVLNIINERRNKGVK